MSGVTQKDNVKNEYLQRTIGVVNISGKLTERRLKWCGHVRSQSLEHACRQTIGSYREIAIAIESEAGDSLT